MAGVPDHVIYAQVEQTHITQDYAPHRSCVRLVGVDESSFRSAAFNLDTGCSTYFVDIAWDYLHATLFSAGAGTIQSEPWIAWALARLDDWPGELWVKIQYSRTDLREPMRTKSLPTRIQRISRIST